MRWSRGNFVKIGMDLSSISDQQFDFIKPSGPSNVKKTSQIKVKVNKQSLTPFPCVTLILQVPLCIEKFLAS